MKKLIAIACLIFSAMTVKADFNADGKSALELLFDRPQLSLVCIAQGLAFGVFYDKEERSVMVAIDDVKRFGTQSTQISKSLPGSLKVKMPKTLKEIPADLIVGKDQNGDILAVTTGSTGVEKEIACAYRANKTLYKHVIAFPSKGGIQLE